MSQKSASGWRYLPWVTAGVSLGMIALMLWPLKNPTSLDDGLRHLAMARLYATQGVQAVGGWGHFFYEGFFHRSNIDPWFLSDLTFTLLTTLPTTLALKVFAFASAALLLAGFLLATRKLKLTPAGLSFLILLFLFGETEFIGRVLIARPFSLMTALTLLTFVCVSERQFFSLAILLALTVLLSQLFVFPLLVAGIGLLWLTSIAPRDALKGAIAVAGGLIVGLALHPSPFSYLLYLLTIFLRIPFLKSIGLGTEMATGLGSAAMVFVLIGIALLLHVAAAAKRVTLKQMHARGITLLESIVLILTVMFLVWIRAIDVLWPFLILLIAILSSLKPRLLKTTALTLIPRWFYHSLIAFALILFIVRIGMLERYFVTTDGERSLAAYAQDMSGIPPGSRVLDVDWYLLPVFVAVRPDLTYATGIDPSFTYLTDPKAYELLHMPETGIFEREHPVVDAHAWLQQLTNLYPGDYLVLDAKRHRYFVKALEQTEVSQTKSDEPLVVFRL